MNGYPPSPPDTIQLMITNGERMVDPDTERKKRPVKLLSRRKETIEPDENRDNLQLQSEKLNLASNNDYWTETSSCINSTTQTQKRRASKKQCKRNICTSKSAEDQNFVKAFSSGTVNDDTRQQDCSPCPVSTQLTVINGEEINTLGGNDNGKKMVPNTCSKRKKGMHMDKSCSLAPPIRTVEMRMDNGNSVESRSFNRMASKKIKEQNRKNKGTKPTSVVQDVVHESCENSGPKKSECGDKSCSDKHLGIANGDGITLACYLRSKSKKRKLDVSDHADMACPPLNNPKELESFCEGVDQPHVGNSAVTIMHDDGLTCCDNGVRESFSSCKTNSSHLRDDTPTFVATEYERCGVNPVREQNVGFHEPVREPASINMEDDHERDDISVASFMKRKSKKKPQNAKTGAQAWVPSSMVKRSKLPPERAYQFHDANHLAFMASDGEPGGLDLVERQKAHEPEREQVSNSGEGDKDTDDITLACFLRHRKSRKRRL